MFKNVKESTFLSAQQKLIESIVLKVAQFLRPGTIQIFKLSFLGCKKSASAITALHKERAKKLR